MNIKILAIIIGVLIVLIISTIFLLPEKDLVVENGNTDFSFIGKPVVTPEPLFTDLLVGTPDPVQQNVLDNLYLDEYYVYPCDTNGTKSDALVLVAQYKPDNAGINSFNQAEIVMKSFENSLYKDWGHIIYKEVFNPNLSLVNFNDEVINDDEVWAKKYRVGNLSDGTTKIYYGWILNYIIVASSKECLLETMQSTYDVH